MTDPLIEVQGSTLRSWRGGSWNYHQETLQSAIRFSDEEDRGNDHFGFRIAGAFQTVFEPTIHPFLEDATPLGNDWYIDPALGLVYQTDGANWLYQSQVGWIFSEPGTNWFYFPNNGLGWLYIDESGLNTDSDLGVSYSYGYLFSGSLDNWIYLQTVNNGDGTVSTLYYDYSSLSWNTIQ